MTSRERLWGAVCLVLTACAGGGCPEADGPVSTVNAELGWEPAVLGFGDVYVSAAAERAVRLTNRGGAEVGYAVTVEGATAFALVSRAEDVLAPGEEREVRARFAPVDVATYAATLQVQPGEGATVSVPLSGAGRPVPICDDDNPCTDDLFLIDEDRCQYVPHTRGCDPGNACVTDASCFEGVCRGDAVTCPTPATGCMEGVCDPQAGCVERPRAGACDDGDPCTDDVCTAGQGCTQVPAADFAPCADDEACGVAHVCQAGACVAIDIPVGTPCDDGDFCTESACTDTICVGGVVSGGAVVGQSRPHVRGDVVHLPSGRWVFWERGSSHPVTGEERVRVVITKTQSDGFVVLGEFVVGLGDGLGGAGFVSGAWTVQPEAGESFLLRRSEFSMTPTARFSRVTVTANDGVEVVPLDPDDDAVARLVPRVVVDELGIYCAPDDGGFVAFVDDLDQAPLVTGLPPALCSNQTRYAPLALLAATPEGVYSVEDPLDPVIVPGGMAPSSPTAWNKPWATPVAVGYVDVSRVHIFVGAGGGYTTFAWPPDPDHPAAIQGMALGEDNPMVFTRDQLFRIDAASATLTNITVTGAFGGGAVGAHRQVGPVWRRENGQPEPWIALGPSAARDVGTTGGALHRVGDDVVRHTTAGVERIFVDGGGHVHGLWGPRSVPRGALVGLEDDDGTRRTFAGVARVSVVGGYSGGTGPELTVVVYDRGAGALRSSRRVHLGGLVVPPLVTPYPGWVADGDLVVAAQTEPDGPPRLVRFGASSLLDDATDELVPATVLGDLTVLSVQQPLWLVRAASGAWWVLQRDAAADVFELALVDFDTNQVLARRTIVPDGYNPRLWPSGDDVVLQLGTSVRRYRWDGVAVGEEDGVDGIERAVLWDGSKLASGGVNRLQFHRPWHPGFAGASLEVEGTPLAAVLLPDGRMLMETDKRLYHLEPPCWGP